MTAKPMCATIPPPARCVSPLAPRLLHAVQSLRTAVAITAAAKPNANSTAQPRTPASTAMTIVAVAAQAESCNRELSSVVLALPQGSIGEIAIRNSSSSPRGVVIWLK